MALSLYDGITWSCEVGFDHGPLVTSPTWYDVTADVKRVSIKGGGISGDFGDSDAGTFSVDLANDGDALRRYDPTYAAGTYYGRLLPGRQLRIRVTVPNPSTTYDLCRGPVDGWDQRWQQPSGSTVTLTGSDMLGVLAQTPYTPSGGIVSADTAIGLILDQASWPAGLRSIGSPASTVVDMSALSGSIAEALRTVARTEQGRLYVDGAGAVQFRPLTWALTNATTTTSAATYGDGASDLPLGADFELFDGGRWIYNRVDVQGAVAADATSAAAYLSRGVSISSAHPTDSERPESFAAWILGRTKDPHPRPGQIVIRPRMDTTQTLVPRSGFTGLFHALGYVPGQRITAARRPANTAVISIPFLVERISHDFDARDWVMAIEPGPVTNVNGETYAAWDTSTWDGGHVWAP